MGCHKKSYFSLLLVSPIRGKKPRCPGSKKGLSNKPHLTLSATVLKEGSLGLDNACGGASGKGLGLKNSKTPLLPGILNTPGGNLGGRRSESLVEADASTLKCRLFVCRCSEAGSKNNGSRTILPILLTMLKVECRFLRLRHRRSEVGFTLNELRFFLPLPLIVLKSTRYSWKAESQLNAALIFPVAFL